MIFDLGPHLAKLVTCDDFILIEEFMSSVYGSDYRHCWNEETGCDDDDDPCECAACLGCKNIRGLRAEIDALPRPTEKRKRDSKR